MPDRRDAFNFYGTLNPLQYHRIPYAVMDAGMLTTDQRGDVTFEVLNANLVLRNPLNRVVTSRARMMNLGFAFAEVLSEVNGDDSIAMMTAFIPSYSRFSSDGCTIDGSYATRLQGFGDQLTEVIKMLRKDPNTRRAVMTVYDRDDLLFEQGGRNTPCTLSLQFINRNGILHAITNMRSNDVHLGLTYDIFNFTMLQEYVARMTGAVIGTYYHNAGSLHLYQRDIPIMIQVSDERKSFTELMGYMPYATALELKRIADRVSHMAHDAAADNLGHFSDYSRRIETRYSYDILAVCFAHASKRVNVHHAWAVSNKISDGTLKYVTQNWLMGKTH